jgi:hypothetical protein
LGRDAVDAAALARNGIAGRVLPVSDFQARRRTALKRTAKSCGPDASVPASSLAEVLSPNRVERASFRKATVATKPIAGEITI